MQPDISIIVPVYNVEPFLDQGIKSLVVQTHKNIEIILVDDGSSDDSSLICDSWEKKDSRIQVIHQENQGVSVARNVGIEKANGKYIMFFDPDDWLEYDCCDIVFDYIEERNADVVIFQSCEEYLGNTKQHPVGKVTFSDMKIMQLNILKQTRLDFCCPIDVPWGRIIRKDVLLKYNIRFMPGIKISQDGLFNLYLFEHINEAYCMDYTGYHYRQNTGSVNYRYNPNTRKNIKNFVIEAEKFILNYHNNNEYKRALGIRCILMISLMEKTYFFHRESKLTFNQIYKEYLLYVGDRIISKYIDICNIKDCNSLKMKIRCYLLKRGHIGLFFYYILASFYQRTNKESNLLEYGIKEKGK